MTGADPAGSPPPRRLPGRAGVTLEQVIQAADAVLRRGPRPTIERVRRELGRGSPNTINPLLDQWWARLGARLQAGPAALQRLPEGALHILECLFIQLLENARSQAADELASTRGSVEQSRSDLKTRSHVLSLRESELEERLRERARTLDAMQVQITTLTALLARATAGKESADRRTANLETELADLRSRLSQIVQNAVLARRRAVRRPAPRKQAPRAPARPERRSRPAKKRGARRIVRRKQRKKPR